MEGKEPALERELENLRDRITALERTETELKNTLAESETNFRAVFNGVHDAIFIHGLDGTIIDVNDRMLQLYGVRREQALTQSIIDDYSSADDPVDKLPGIWNRVVSGENQFFEWKCRRPLDGSVFDCEVFLQKIRLQDRDAIIAHVRDITDRKQAERELRKAYDELEVRVRERTAELQLSEERSRIVTENAEDGVITVDESSTIIMANPAAERIFSYKRSEMIGQSLTRFMPERYRQRHVEAVRRFIVSGIRQVPWTGIRFPGLRSDGAEVLLEMSFGEYVKDAKHFFTSIVRDISEQARMEAALRESERNRRLIMDAVPALIAYVDRDARYEFVNRQYATWFQRTAEEIVGKKMQDILGQDLFASIRMQVEAVLRGESVSYERSMERNGQQRYFKVEYEPDRDEAGSVRGFFALLSDISDRKKIEELAMHQASHDCLTGLANRTLFAEHFERELAQTRRSEKKLAVVFLDLDQFKVVNDTVGHDGGDALLQEASHRLRSGLRASDILARTGGDEFNMLLSDLTDARDATVILKKIKTSFQRPFRIKGEEFLVTASMGVSIYPDDGTDSETLLSYADIALYHAKEQGRDQYQFYSPAINSRSIERLDLEIELRRALERDELKLYYLPQKDMDTGKIISAEVLLRWQHPQRGLLRAVHFIDVAEESGLIIPIGEWIVRTACARNKAWQEAGYLPFPVTINLSRRQFHRSDLAESTVRMLQEVKLDPQWLEFEVSEGTAMRDVQFTAVCMEKLASAGIKISIDDFGTGRSSLYSLRKLPIGKVKIDRSFIADIPHDPDNRAIVRAAIALSHSLRLKTIAVGVENQDQVSFLRSSHCDEMQGYLVTEPLPHDKFVELIKG